MTTDYPLGSPSPLVMKYPEGFGRQHVPKSGPLIPGAGVRCHALGENGRPLCGYAGPIYPIGAKWSSMVPKCLDCRPLVEPEDEPERT